MIDQFVLDELEQALDDKAKPILEMALKIHDDNSLTALDIFFILKEVYDKGKNDGYDDGFERGSEF